MAILPGHVATRVDPTCLLKPIPRVDQRWLGMNLEVPRRPHLEVEAGGCVPHLLLRLPNRLSMGCLIPEEFDQVAFLAYFEPDFPLSFA